MSLLIPGIAALLAWLWLWGYNSGLYRQIDNWTFQKQLKDAEWNEEWRQKKLQEETRLAALETERDKLVRRIKLWKGHEGPYWEDNLKKLIPLLTKEHDPYDDLKL